MCTGPVRLCYTCRSYFAVDRERCADPYSDFHRYDESAIRIYIDFCDWCETVAHRTNRLEIESLTEAPTPEQALIQAPQPQVVEPEPELQLERVEPFQAWAARRQTSRRIPDDVMAVHRALQDIESYTHEVINHLDPRSFEAVHWHALLTMIDRAADRPFNFIPADLYFNEEVLSFQQFRRGDEPGMIYKWEFDESLERHTRYLWGVSPTSPRLLGSWRADLEEWSTRARSML